jgi:hypothetical protein
MNAAGLAHQLGATRAEGNTNWRAPCPLGCGYALSFRDAPDGRLLAFCFGGCEFNTIMTALVEYGLLDDDGADLEIRRNGRAVPAREDNGERFRRIEKARKIYDAGVEDERIATYLRSRCISLTSPILRFSEAAPHRTGVRLPAMLAPIVGVDGAFLGVHMTYLRGDGRGKADLPRELQRETRGALKSGTIRLMALDPARELLVCEGIGLPAWSAVFACGLKVAELPPEAARVVIGMDNDASGASQRSALIGRDRWTAEGRSVRLKIPPVPGQDFNDVLIERRGDARR